MQYGGPVHIVHFKDISKETVSARIIMQASRDFCLPRARHAPKPIKQMQPRTIPSRIVDLALQMLGELFG
jgi:hypothetical protein